MKNSKKLLCTSKYMVYGPSLFAHDLVFKIFQSTYGWLNAYDDWSPYPQSLNIV